MKGNDNKRSLLETYAPPGIPIMQEVRYWMIGMSICTIWCLQFLLRYWEERSSLYYQVGGRLVLFENAVMPTFWDLTANLFVIFYLVLIYCVMAAGYHYVYHYQGSKMIYLMRRLPNKWELHIRCLVLPIVAGILTVVYRYLLEVLFYAVYIFCTPPQCLPLPRFL